jgi:uncharacterized protein YeaO (DUF488 family)
VIRAKHLRAERAEPADGTRILVTRYYPRGIPASQRLWDEWQKELAPSRALHGDIKDGRISWDAYEARYLAEMGTPAAQAALAALAERARGGERLTLLCDHPRTTPQERCHRFLLQRLLERRIATSRTTRPTARSSICRLGTRRARGAIGSLLVAHSDGSQPVTS